MNTHIQRIKNILLNQCENLSDGECMDEALDYIEAIPQQKIYFTMNTTYNKVWQVFYNQWDFIEKHDRWQIHELDRWYDIFSIEWEPTKESIYTMLEIPF